MKEKGMTLVELLAVIVVLAIVSLIAVPTVLNIISRVRLNVLKDSAYGLVEAGTLYNAQYQNTKNIRFDIEDTTVSSNDTEDLLDFKGKVKKGTVIVSKQGKTTVCISDGTNSAYKNYDETKVTLVKSQTCTIPENTYVVYLDGEATRDELSNPQLTDLLYALQEEINKLKLEKANQSDLDVTTSVALANQEAIENMPTSEVLDSLALKVQNLETNATTKGYVDDNINTLRSEIPSIDNLATKSELNAVEVIASNAKTAAENAATKTELNAVNTIALANQEAIKGLASASSLETVSSAAKAAQEAANSKPSLNDIYPIGSIYITTTNTNPETYISGTTWVAFGSGRTIVGVNSSNNNFKTVEKTGGSATHSHTYSGTVDGTQLTVANLPSHTHTIPKLSGSTNETGGHTHERGTMDITGGFGVRAWTTSSVGTPFGPTSGAFYKAGDGASGTANGIGSGMNSVGYYTMNFKASNSWEGETSTSGAHSHTVETTASATTTCTNCNGDSHNHTYSGTTDSGSTLQPYITVYMWKRTA